MFSRDELARYDGTGPDGAIYLAVLGEVYDVTAGAKFYGPSDGAEYRDLVGRDASSAFATGWQWEETGRSASLFSVIDFVLNRIAGQFSSHAPDVHKVASLSDSDVGVFTWTVVLYASRLAATSHMM